jgi:hypothetical protein
MAATNNGSAQNWIGGAAAVAALLFCVALILAAWDLGAQLTSGWLVFLFQILFGIIASLICFALLARGFTAVLNRTLDTLSSMQYRFPTQVKQVRDRAAAFAAGALLLAQGVTMLADKSFANPQRALLVSLVLTLIFWISNELMLRPSRVEKAFGIGSWFVGLAYLLFAVLLDNHWRLAELLSGLRDLSAVVVSTHVVVLIGLALIPCMIRWGSPADG